MRVLLLACLAASLCAAQTLDVKIIDRQNHDSMYTYVLPGYATANTMASASCAGGNCAGGSTTTATSIPGRSGSYQVSGATFTLELPDKRLVIVNCESKYALKGDGVNKRSCRVPLVDEIEADFKKNKAKLKWPVSLDGKSFQSETYKIVAVL